MAATDTDPRERQREAAAFGAGAATPIFLNTAVDSSRSDGR